MKRIVILILFLTPFFTFSQGAPKLEIDWIPLQKAKEYAKKYNKESVIYVPKETTKLRIKAIEFYGADVHQLDLNYEETCAYASKKSIEMNWQLIQDTS